MMNVARLRRQNRILTEKLRASARKRVAVLVGWQDIAAALEVSDTTAMAYANREIDPLPVWYGHDVSRPRIGLGALRAWVKRQAHFFRTYHALKRAGQLPGQVRTYGKKQRRQVKAAVKAKAA